MTHLGFRRNTLELAVIMLISVKRYLSPVSCTELPTSKQAIKLLPNSNKPSMCHQIGTSLQNAIKFRHAIRMPSNTHLSTIALNFALLWVHVRFLHSSSDRIHSFTFRWGFPPDILFETKRRHLLQIQGNNVFLLYKTFWITEAPSMIVENRFFFWFVIVFIVVGLEEVKSWCQKSVLDLWAHINAF